MKADAIANAQIEEALDQDLVDWLGNDDALTSNNL